MPRPPRYGRSLIQPPVGATPIERNRSAPRTVAFVSLGCAKNLVDSEKMLGQLAEAGILPVSDPAQADVIVVNTCGFLQASQAESLAAIRQAAEWKRTGRARRIVVAGCLATRLGRRILAEVEGIDALVGANQRDRIVSAVVGPSAPNGAGPSVYLGKCPSHVELDTARLRLTPRHYAYLRISEGCSHGCAFCTIPAIRGPARSKPLHAVLAEAAELIADGALELNLIGQDTTGYGADLGLAGGLAALLRRLDRLDGARWIRLLYTYPAAFTDALIDALGDCEHVVPYVDIPLQHINDALLARMRRKVTRRQIETLLGRLRARIPGLAVRTTFIAGLPGETDREHGELLRFIEDFAFDMLGVFCYSREPKTVAARMAGQVPEEIKRARRDELMTAQQRIVFRRNAALVGGRTTVLTDGRGRQGLVGRTPSQAPEVDSVTFLTGRGPRGRRLAPGRLLPARIIGYKGYDLLAEATGAPLAETVAPARPDAAEPLPYQPLGVATVTVESGWPARRQHDDSP